MDSNTSPGQYAPEYPSPVLAAQPATRKLQVVRKAIGNSSPPSGQEQQPNLTPGTSRSASVDISAIYQHGSPSHAPELHRINTATSAVSSGRDSVFSNNAPMSPLTNVTTPSPLASPLQSDNRLSLGYAVQAAAPLSSPLAVCAGCAGAIQPTNKVIQCLICSSANQASVITRLCLHCYAAHAPRTGHKHDTSFLGCDSDSIVQDNRLPPELWTVRRNSSARMWFEHRPSGFKTWITPMTAVVVLPPGWVHMRDPQGNLYYQNNITRETTRIHPANLPSGWTEAKDPDGKSFFVHNDLQLASWCRPGQQPLFAASTAAAISNNQAARPPIADNLTTSKIRPQPIAMAPKPNVQGQRPIARLQPGQQQVSLATVTEATINLLDPSNGGIVRNTKIVGHIAGQSVKGTVKAVAQNQRLQTFARGTGIAMANKKVKKAWRKAAKEVASLEGRRKQEIRVTQTGPQGKIAVQGIDDSFDGEYVIEYEDGSIEYYDAQGRLLRTSTIGSQRVQQQNPKLVHRPANQQRPQPQPVHGPQLLLQSAQQTQTAQLQHPQLQENFTQSPSGSSQQGQIQSSQTIQVQSQPCQSQQVQPQQFQNQPQVQQNQSLMGQLQQAAQDQIEQAVQQHLAQIQSQPQSQTQQTQSILQQQQAQNQQMQQLLEQSKIQAQQNFNQQLQQQLQEQQQQMASRPAAQSQYGQNQPGLLDQAVYVLQQSSGQQPQTASLIDQVLTQTVYMDSSPAQAIYIDQAPTQTLFVDPFAEQQTVYVDQAAYLQDRVLYMDGAAGDVNVEVSIEENVYVDQSYSVQEETVSVEGGNCEQVYELQDDGCVDWGFEVGPGDCGGFEDVGCDF
ncbi:hypothetical protein E6O75_ATG05395 [Venturia nashicola]|uniref:WW domain-containing protein n=1 Tax=Venturia nashicola TaxID=86259 RepID=A0A4Z1P7X5_9PEZI|nr:hypothetical protein E6O75_ATG05395 [Venturia nashicola]